MKPSTLGISVLCVLFFSGAGLASEPSFWRELPGPYVPGKELQITLHMDSYFIFAEIYETIPPGWSIRSVDPSDPMYELFLPFTSFDELTGTIFWRLEPEWIVYWPLAVRYLVVPPADQTGELSFDGHILYRRGPDDPLVDASTAGDTVVSRREKVGILRYRPDWASIQATIDASEWGDTVMISAGETPYVESIVMKPGVSLVGFVDSPSYDPPSYKPPVVEGASPDQPAIIAAPDTRISGFIIRSSSCGIRVDYPRLEISDCVITGCENAAIEYVGASEGKVTNCTVAHNTGAGILCQGCSPEVVISNSILFGNGGKDVENCTARFCLLEDEMEEGWGENNISGDPMFVNPVEGDYGVHRGSPCIDAGDSTVRSLEDTDILGGPRIMFGGTSETVDIGAYEYWFISASRQPGSADVQFCWASRPEKTYSVFFSDDLMTWHPAADNVPAAGSVTEWLDPVGWPASVPSRFYRVMENE